MSAPISSRRRSSASAGSAQRNVTVRTFTYKLNGFDTANRSLKKAHLCRVVTGTLIAPDKIVRIPAIYSAPILFQTNAETITEADAAFEKRLGYSPALPNIGASFA